MTLLLIHTGGTIAMAMGPQGLMPRDGVLETGLTKLQRAGIPGCAVQILCLDPLIDSANASFRDWNRIAAAIQAGHDRYTGFVITHGTDTLAFTAAALSFALAGLKKPVIVTGSMLPFETQGSDARANLAEALIAATHSPAGVWVQFAGKLLHGARVRKSHSHAADAFTAAPWTQDPCRLAQDITRTAYLTPELAILTLAPNQSTKAISLAIGACDGVVLRVFGAGTMPDDPQLIQTLKTAHDRGVLILVVSQSPEGGVALGTYAAGAPLIAAGAIDGGQMTPEAAYAKLAHVLSSDARPAAQRARLVENLCGEM